MQPEFWLERWEKNEIRFHQQEVNRSLQKYWPRLGLPRGATVLVPLCGKSLDMVWLRAQGYRVLGIELIQRAVRDFFAENGIDTTVSKQPPFERWEADGISIWCGDFFDLTAADVKDITGLYDRASLIAFPPEVRPRYVAKLGELLQPGVESLLITVSYPQQQMPGPPFAVSEDEVRKLYADKFAVEVLHTQDILAKEPRFRERGLTRMEAQAFRARRLDAK